MDISNNFITFAPFLMQKSNSYGKDTNMEQTALPNNTKDQPVSFKQGKRPVGLKYFLQRLYYEYRSVMVFAFILSACVVVSHWLARYIPVSLFEQRVLPAENACVLATSIWGAVMLLRHSEGIMARKIMAYVLIFWALLEGVALYFTFSFDSPIFLVRESQILAQSMLIANLCGWMMLLYPIEALNPGWLTPLRAFWLLAPLIALTALFYMIDVDLRILIALYPVFVFLVILRHLQAYRKWCEENFSSLEDTDVQWIWKYLMMLLIVGLSYYYICYTHFPTRMFTQMWLILYLIMHTTDHILFHQDSWQAVRKQEQMASIHNQAINPNTEAEIETLLAENNADEPLEPDEIQMEEFARYKTVLENWMQTEKPYLDSNLRRSDLMRVVPINRTYFSQFMNVEFGCNFYQYVTSYRIAEAKRLMTEHPGMKLQEVAERSGFSSPTVFSRTFLRAEGVTPTDWGK